MILSRRKFLQLTSAALIALFGGSCTWLMLGRNKEIAPPADSTDDGSLIYPLPPLAPPPEHPRLYLRQSDIPSIKAKMNHPETANIWRKIVRNSQGRTTSSKINDIINVYEANALIFVLQGDKQAGTKAKSLLMDNIAHYDTIKEADSRDIGVFIGSAAIVYDWCYPLFSEEERRTVIAQMKRAAAKMETGYPPVKQSSITGHAGENLIMRDLLSAGVAFYDEDREIYNLAAGRFFSELLPARNFFYPSGAYHQGVTYGNFRYSCDLWPTFIFDRMGLGSVYDTHQGEIPYQWIYMRRPDGMMLSQGDTTSEAFYPLGTYVSLQRLPYLMAGSYYRNPHFKEEYYRQFPSASDTSVPLYKMLFSDPDLPRKPIYELPLSRYFGSPFGQMIARTGWDDGTHLTDKNSPIAVALMKVGEYDFGNHDHRDIGSFQLYYKGSLAIDSGLYDGTNGKYGSPHQVNYSKATIAHNCVLVYDPADTSIPKKNDGGQRFLPEPKNLDSLLNDGFATGFVLAHEFGPDPIQPDFTYLKGDIAKAYSDKVTQYYRSFVFLNLKNRVYPAALIVFDKVVSANKDFKKYWLLHSIEEPLIDGRSTTIRRSTDGYNGELVNVTLLPAENNLSIEKVGGPGHEFDVFGTNYPNATKEKVDAREQGAWRIQLSPQTASETDYFLNVMQVKDNDGTPPLIPETIISDRLAGVKIWDRVVCFSKSGERLKEPVSFRIDGQEPELKYLICDLAEGEWKVEKIGEGTDSTHKSGKESGTLYFGGAAGSYRLTYVS